MSRCHASVPTFRSGPIGVTRTPSTDVGICLRVSYPVSRWRLLMERSLRTPPVSCPATYTLDTSLPSVERRISPDRPALACVHPCTYTIDTSRTAYEVDHHRRTRASSFSTNLQHEHFNLAHVCHPSLMRVSKNGEGRSPDPLPLSSYFAKVTSLLSLMSIPAKSSIDAAESEPSTSCATREIA